MEHDPATSPKKQKGSPALIILMAGIVGPTVILGNYLGAGQAGIVGGFVAMFTLISCMGRSLYSNFTRFIIVGPLIAIFSIVPRVIAPVCLPLAISLAVLGVFIAGILPLRNRTYNTAAIGLGTSTLLGYSLPVSQAQPSEFFIAAGAGLIVAALLILLLGIKDPSGPTRRMVSELFADNNRNFSAAFEAWTIDGSPHWLGLIMEASVEYRLARAALKPQAKNDPALQDLLNTINDQANQLMVAIKNKKHLPAQAPQATETIDLAHVNEHYRHALTSMIDALDKANKAETSREKSSVAIPLSLRHHVRLNSIRSAIGGHSLQVRHALRTTIAVFLTFLISLRVPHGDPLLPTLLVTSFALIQSSKNATFMRARARFIGISIGGIAAFGIIIFLPSSILFPLSIVALAVGMWYIADSPAIGTGALIIMAVGYNFEMRHIAPMTALTEYFIFALIAIIISSIVGFTVIPAWRPPSLMNRLSQACMASAHACTLLSLPRSTSSDEEKIDALTQAQTAIHQLAPDHEDLSSIQRRLLKQTRHSFEDLLAVAVFQSLTQIPDIHDQLLTAADILQHADLSPFAVDDDSALNLPALALRVRTNAHELINAQ